MPLDTHPLTTLFEVTQPPPRLLLVDDQSIHIQLLHELFRDECHIFIATSGQRALDICRDHPPDLILLDVEMPGMDGFEVCRRLMADPATRNIPVIFLTAHNDAQQETQGLELGAVDFIAKPINPAVVRARVRTHLTLKRQSDSMRRLAFLDGLTGVYNRRYFDQQFAIEAGRSLRSGAPLALVLIDIDCFKPYNDRYGHQAGDDCLRLVARCLKASFKRPADLFARYGGEEFVGVLPDTGLEAALALAGQMERSVRALELPHEASLVASQVTISAGVSAWEGERSGDAQALLEVADAWLYRAKHSGRGQVCGGLGPPAPMRES